MQRQARIYWSVSLFYLVCTLLPPFPGDFVPKALPIVLLLLWSLQLLAGRTRMLMAFALVFSATGDVVLNLNLFIPGLAAFLLAQCLYAVLFLSAFRWRQDRHWAYAALLIYLVALGAILVPGLGDMTYAVLAYMAAITWMAFNALSQDSDNPWIPLGAALFVLSDSLIAVNRFLVEIPLAGLAIMLAYYLAQWWIFRGIVAVNASRCSSKLLTVAIR